jgi:hypothetical protein
MPSIESSLPAQSLMELPERLDGRLGGQQGGVEYFESHQGIIGAQRTARPFALQLSKDVLAFLDGQMTPLHFGHKKSLGVLRVRCHEIQLDTALPVPLRAGKSGPAEVLEDGRGVVMDELALLLCGVSTPERLMRRIHAKPEAHGRVGDLAAFYVCQALCSLSIMSEALHPLNLRWRCQAVPAGYAVPHERRDAGNFSASYDFIWTF